MGERTEANVAITRQNGGLLDLARGEWVTDGEGERAMFLGYGPNEPVYVNLDYPGYSKTVRLPNSELRRAR